jgi:hypothetical protein
MWNFSGYDGKPNGNIISPIQPELIAWVIVIIVAGLILAWAFENRK